MPNPKRHRRFYTLIAAAIASSSCGNNFAAADPAVSLDFNGPKVNWQLRESNVPAQILAHECVPGGARDDGGFERLVVASSAGQSVLLACPIARVAALDEFGARLWVRSSRAGIQLAANVVLPRSRDPKSGRTAASVIVKGTAYNRPGHWQQLSLAGITELIAAQVRVLRALPGAAIDAHEAFVDAVVLVVPGEPQGLEVAIDNLEVDGIMLPGTSPTRIATSVADTTATISVRLQGGTLSIDGRAMVPRVVQWQGEPLPFLAERGFNVVGLPSPPTADQVEAAQKNALWFMCSAPTQDAISAAGIGQPGDRVVAWLLDDDALEVDPDYARRWAQAIREHDVVSGRPVLFAPRIDWSVANKAADVLLAAHPHITRMTPPDYDAWLSGRPRLARPGMPFWAYFATQVSDTTSSQVAALSGAQPASLSVDLEQLAEMVHTASARGVRGFVFNSNSPLNASDPATRRRAAALETINHRLRLIEPWLAQGKLIGRVSSVDKKWVGAVLHVDRARLMIPLPQPATAPSANSIANATLLPSNHDTLFVVAGIPESSQAFLISPAVMRTLQLQRVAGGTRIALQAPNDGFVLVTEDPHVIQVFRQRNMSQGANYVRAERDFANQQAALITSAVRRSPKLGQSNDALRRCTAINLQLAQIDPLLTAGRNEQAQAIAVGATRALERITDELRRIAGGPANLDSNPLAVSDEAVAECAEFGGSLANLSPGDNQLLGGDFEDLSRMTESGWQHENQESPGVASGAQLSAADAQQGRYCLELRVTPADGTSGVIPNTPVQITSPRMPVSEGQAIEISGWVRVDTPISGDGLQIIDSLGGPELSLAIRETTGWQPFRMIRGVSKPTELRLTFALAGIGAAKIDGVMVQPFQQPTPRRLPAATSPLAIVERGFTPPAGQSVPRRVPSAPTTLVESVNVPPLNQPAPRRLPPTNSTATNEVEGPLFAAPQTR